MSPTQPAAEQTAPVAERTPEQVSEEAVIESPVPEAKPEHDADWWKAKAAAIDAENKRALKRLQELEKAEQDRQKAAMTKEEQLQAELAEEQKQRIQVETDLQTARTNDSIAAIARKFNFADVKGDVLPQLDFSAIEYDDSGQPTERSILPQLEKLAKDKPYLVLKKVAAAGNITNPPGGSQELGETDAERRYRLGIGTKPK